MPFYAWSTTPASNATSDPTCPFPEGMAPSAVNDGVRGAMARLREFGNDIAGAIATTGSATAYGVASFEGFTSLAALNGQAIAFTPHVTCGATVTLNVDGLGAQPLRSSPGVELMAGTIIQGTPYVAVYSAAAGAFYLRSFFGNPYNVPVGAMLPFLSITAPNSSFVLPYGQAISRTAYATLFSMVGTAFGGGDGATTFNVPDLRGRSIFGLDTMGGSAAGRLTSSAGGVDGTTIGANGGVQTVTLSRANLPNTNVAVTVTDPGHAHPLPALITPSGGLNIPSGGGVGNNSLSTGAAATGISASFNLNGNVTQVAVQNLPPAIVVPWILRVI
ncbi:MAG: phage tail protein [Xanthobacteraceae bacterium]|nr:phage tail protein [Xanthobacteraceae bacterium]